MQLDIFNDSRDVMLRDKHCQLAESETALRQM